MESKFKVNISISSILDNAAFRRAFNSLDLHDINFYDDNDNEIEITEKIINDFKSIGLSNIDFILTGFYKDGWQK